MLTVLEVLIYIVYKVDLIITCTWCTCTDSSWFSIPNNPSYILKNTTLHEREKSSLLFWLLRLQHRDITGIKCSTRIQGNYLHSKKPGVKILSFCPSFCGFLAVNYPAHYHLVMLRFKNLYNDLNNASFPHQGAPKLSQCLHDASGCLISKLWAMKI